MMVVDLWWLMKIMSPLASKVFHHHSFLYRFPTIRCAHSCFFSLLRNRAKMLRLLRSVILVGFQS
jgi:hypothetical protein